MPKYSGCDASAAAAAAATTDNPDRDSQLDVPEETVSSLSSRLTPLTAATTERGRLAPRGRPPTKEQRYEDHQHGTHSNPSQRRKQKDENFRRTMTSNNKCCLIFINN